MARTAAPHRVQPPCPLCYPFFTRRGFSLVELSIVLVILGLLTGGILAGQSLTRAAELRAVSTEFNRYLTATQTFRDKYFALPGDFNKATSFWGIADAAPNVCRFAVNDDTRTCNGNGSGIVGDALPAANENFAFWKQLANALIEGNYRGAGEPAASYLTPSPLNVPRSKIGNAGLWGVYNPVGGYITGGAYFQGPNYGNFLMLTREFGGGSNNQIGLGLMIPEEAWNIDTKMDDGKPGTGKLVSNYSNCTTGGASNTDVANANYRLGNSTQYCMLFFTDLF